MKVRHRDQQDTAGRAVALPRIWPGIRAGESLIERDYSAAIFSPITSSSEYRSRIESTRLADRSQS